jgi:hypothetical protein
MVERVVYENSEEDMLSATVPHSIEHVYQEIVGLVNEILHFVDLFPM